MSNAFQARFEIVGAGSITPPYLFEVFADVLDSSLAGYSVSDVAAGDVFYDENLLNGETVRYKITLVITRGPSAYPGGNANSIHARCLFDDTGSPDPAGPAASSGIICRTTSLGTSEIPAFTIQSVSEQIVTKARNIDNRYITSPKLSSSYTLFFKDMVAKSAISINAPVSKRTDGKIETADSDSAQGQKPIGVAVAAASLEGDIIKVMLMGPSLTNALSGLGFVTGDDIYISETTGFTNNPDSLTGGNDSVIRVGTADCAEGTASGTAVDLIALPDVVIRP